MKSVARRYISKSISAPPITDGRVFVRTPPQQKQQGTGSHTTDQINEKLSVVIVTYHNVDDIRACLRAVERATPRIPMEVVVVDNASGDGTVAAVRASAPPGTRVIEQNINSGFAVGCRTGAEAASGDWLLFLNPDTTIAPDAIDALLGCSRRHPSAGIVGGRFVHGDGTIDPRSWWGKPSLWSALCFALGLNSLLPGNRLFDPESPRPWTPDPRQETRVPVVSGALMLVQRRLWDALGGFDPAFFIYAEDADFCLRAAALGYRPMVTARAVCQHIGGRSSGSTHAMILLFTGKCTLIRRHFSPGLRTAGVCLLLVGVFLRATVSRLVGEASPARQGRPTARADDWRALWAARRQWRGGWAHATPPAS